MHMHPRDHRGADRPALIMAGSHQLVSFAELDKRANRCAHVMQRAGLNPGDAVAIWMDNDCRFLELCWGAQNAGLLYVPVSARLGAAEAGFIVRDSGARLVIAANGLPVAALARELAGAVPMLVAGGEPSLEEALNAAPETRAAETVRGGPMMYSSGTTGRPKGIRAILDPVGIDVPTAVTASVTRLYGFDASTIYLSTAPFYHAAPLKFCMAVQAAGGTVIAMEHFDAAAALDAIARFGVTHSQWVPTMFIRLLRLPQASRAGAWPTHRVAIHAAAPCPIAIKEQMLDWWGPIVHEYYSGSESIGMCAIGPAEWLARKGSVGRAVRGTIHVLDEAGAALPPMQDGLICFEGGTPFAYHNDAAKTARAVDSHGRATLGDIGHVDHDGYLYLVDRRDDVIIVGGVNIYPQEAENLLAGHPEVGDVAVFGIPDAEYGEAVKAVVCPHDPARAGAALEAELIAFCRASLAGLKCPRSVDFRAALPREPNGKLLKRLLKAAYV